MKTNPLFAAAVLTTLALLSATANARPDHVVIAAYVTTSDGAAAALATLKVNVPFAVAVGKGYKYAPGSVELRCLSPDSQRADWWDNHTDPRHPCTWVLVVSETTRAAVPPAPAR